MNIEEIIAEAKRNQAAVNSMPLPNSLSAARAAFGELKTIFNNAFVLIRELAEDDDKAKAELVITVEAKKEK